MVHAEVVLQRNGRVGLRGGLDGHALFGLNRLVESVGVAASVHDSAGLLVYDFDFALHDHVFHVFFKE